MRQLRFWFNHSSNNNKMRSCSRVQINLLQIRAHQFLCGCPNKGGPPGVAGRAVLPRPKASMKIALYGSNTTTPTWSWRSCVNVIEIAQNVLTCTLHSIILAHLATPLYQERQSSSHHSFCSESSNNETQACQLKSKLSTLLDYQLSKDHVSINQQCCLTSTNYSSQIN